MEKHETKGPAPGLSRKGEFEYKRGGVLAFKAACDVHGAGILKLTLTDSTTGITM
jgi:hypothetical protein